MSTLYFIDQWPSWLIYPFLVVLFSPFHELGYRIGKFRNQMLGSADAIRSTGLVGAVLALLAFMMAFTFGQASSNYAARKQLILQEANAIGSAYLRADLLPDKTRQSIKALLRDYVDLRVKKAGRFTEEKIEMLDKTVLMQDQLWSQTMALRENDLSSVKTSLFIESLNEMFDLHNERVGATFRSRIPRGIRLTLVFLAVASLLLMGYMDGLSGKIRSHFAIAMLILAFSAVLVLIVDLDRPPFTDQRLLSVDHQALVDLQQSIRP